MGYISHQHSSRYHHHIYLYTYLYDKCMRTSSHDRGGNPSYFFFKYCQANRKIPAVIALKTSKGRQMTTIMSHVNESVEEVWRSFHNVIWITLSAARLHKSLGNLFFRMFFFNYYCWDCGESYKWNVMDNNPVMVWILSTPYNYLTKWLLVDQF